MAQAHELFISARDAERLAHLRDASEALADLLVEARLVPHEELPHDRITLDCDVLYQEEPGGTRRTVRVVHPLEASPSEGRISVLSPIGLALLGRTPGTIVMPPMPAGRALSIRILQLNNGGAS